ncbi:MAG TPA: substrate-binding domain-containing protein, partial [Thermodesulfobacteriota bacterium]|nr:substrate-binding domain-containing protein [Thermodesulfobacteriota bacterium]
MGKKWQLIFLVLVIFVISTSGIIRAEELRLRLATTTSTEDTGIIQALNPPFEKMMHIKVDVISVGTGKALELGARGDVDVVLVHAREAEDKFVADGSGVNRRDVMCNDFIIIGPENDPAKIKGVTNAQEAFRKIALAQAPFISRGDDSGTHKKELKIWEKTGIKPQGKWYFEAGQGMGPVLNMANEKQAYTLSDRGTYLAYRGKIGLKIFCEGDPVLNNPYGVIAVNPAKFPHANYVYAMAYIGWLTSPEGQKIIRDFGKDKLGQPLFIPTAIPP